VSGTPAAGRPENLRFISGVIVVSRQAERAAEFYRDVLGLPLAEERHGDTEQHWGCELGDVHFAIHPAEDYLDDPADAPGPVKLAFMVFDLPAMIAWLERCGVPLCYPPARLGPDSQITAVRDPDGNLVELTQLGPGWLDHLRVHRAAGNDLISAWGTRLARLTRDQRARVQARLRATSVAQ
jgi:catechol 2,3-dioxygenase-like lactoylglutathione lyase family enzyme